MISSSIGSSMEAHISHFIASCFSSRPKGYSSNNINKYFMLNDAKINGINLFNTYLQTYNIPFNEKPKIEYKYKIKSTNRKENLTPITLPYMETSNSTPIYEALANLTYTKNEINSL